MIITTQHNTTNHNFTNIRTLFFVVIFYIIRMVVSEIVKFIRGRCITIFGLGGVWSELEMKLMKMMNHNADLRFQFGGEKKSDLR
jgi:hypothetical protein